MKIKVIPSSGDPVEEGIERLGAEHVSFLQSAFWGEFKAEYGWTPLRFAVEVEQSGEKLRILLLLRRLPAGFCFAYVPHGPATELPEAGGAAVLADLSRALRPFLPKRCLFIRFDPPWYALETADVAENDAQEGSGASIGLSEAEVEALRPAVGKPLRRAAADVQPPDTVLVDLRPSEAEILSAMKPKWRYNIRLAEKKGVVVELANADAIPEFYELYRKTSERDRIALHPEEYYRRLFTLASERPSSPDFRLWIARHEGQGLAAIITLFHGKEAVYLYGASSDEKRNLMPAYALQWAAMRAAKAAGCLRYDLFGIPPTGDSGHPMAGLYRFKTGFGGRIAHRAGSWDYPLIGVAYAAFRAAERARAWWFKDFKKRLRRSRKS